MNKEIRSKMNTLRIHIEDRLLRINYSTKKQYTRDYFNIW